MNIHEYQAKQMMDRYGIPVPEGYPADNIEEVEQIMDLHFPDGKVVVKAQIHSGGRGKAGGIILANTKEEAIEAARKLFGKTLVTKQTGPQGKLVRKVYIEKQSQIEREIYLSLLIDTNVGRHTIVACGEGGTSIEELAETDPERIIKETVEPSLGFTAETALNIAKRLDLNETNTAELTDILSNMYDMFIKEDCTLIEINPLAICNEHLMALDA